VAPDFLGQRSETGAIDHGQMAAPPQTQRDVPNVQLGSGAMRKNAIGEQNAKGGVRR
jgi:hypothetical protein